jgi:hypothetical protein
MGDARIDGGRNGDHAMGGGENRQRPRCDYSVHWLERKLRELHRSVVAESVPKELLDIVERLPRSDPPP